MNVRGAKSIFLLLLMALAALGAIRPAMAQTGADAPPVYTLDSGDKIRVTVYGEQTLNGEYSIGPVGDIAFPLIGNIPAKGQTVDQLQKAITAKLAQGYILDPRVSIDVLNYRPYYILGEVGRPGQYPYVNGLTVDQAVATAGGYTYRASKSKVFVRRAGGGAEVEIKLGKGKAVWLMPGDTVRVGERYF